MPKIRVLHFVVRLSYGGIETWLSEVLSHYDRSRFQMDVCCIAKRPDLGELADQARQNGANIYFLQVNRISFLPRLWKLLHLNYDCVDVHFDPVIGFPLLLISWLAKVPLRIISHHNSEYAITNRIGRLTSWMLKIDVRLSTLVTGCSKSTLDRLHPGWRENIKFTTLYYGIDIKRFRHMRDKTVLANLTGVTETTPIVGHIGRFSAQKNHPAFVAMAGELLRLAPEARFVLIGQGELRPQVEKMVAQAGLTDSFHFLGPRSNIPDLLNAIDVLYFPSHFEGFPVTFIEAQASGVPLVTGQRPELREAIAPENRDLLTVDTGNPVHAARRIHQLLTEDGLWQMVSQRGQDWARQNFSIEQSTRRLEEIILSGLSEASAPASEAIL